jgi:hypothetical protein
VLAASTTKPGFFIPINGIKKTNIYAHHRNLIQRRMTKANEIEKGITRYQGEKIHSNPNPICNRRIPAHFGIKILKIFSIINKD